MNSHHPVPLLVAALVLLRHPCLRNEAKAALLLQRASLSAALSHAEREACHELAEELETPSAHPHPHMELR
jgi:hypothetical protein